MKQEVNAGTDHINLARSPLHKLPAGEPILDQLLLRWEGVARREYGVAISVPKDAFQLQLRKTRTRGIKGVSKEEQQLEFWQARDDLLDGRLLRCLGRKEMLELAWETLKEEEEADAFSPKQVIQVIDDKLYKSAVDRYRAFRLLTSDLGHCALVLRALRSEIPQTPGRRR